VFVLFTLVMCGIIGLMQRLKPQDSGLTCVMWVFWWLIAGCSPEVPGDSPEVPGDSPEVPGDPVSAESQPDPEEILRLADRYYYRDDGSAEDPSEAARLYQQACELQHPRTCIEYAHKLWIGRGVAADPAKAAAYVSAEAVSELTAQCDQGLSRACARLGTLHEFGMGIDRSVAEAARIYEKACELDNGCGVPQPWSHLPGWQGCSQRFGQGDYPMDVNTVLSRAS
jgi:hypothetical protein